VGGRAAPRGEEEREAVEEAEAEGGMEMALASPFSPLFAERQMRALFTHSTE